MNGSGGLRICVVICSLVGWQKSSAQSLCNDLQGDTSVQQVVFTTQSGSPFKYYGVHNQNDKRWFSFEYFNKEILVQFLQPVKKARVHWIPSALSLGQQDLLDGTYILEKWRFTATFTFEQGYLVRITTVNSNAIEIDDFEVVNTCKVPVLIVSTVLKFGAPLFSDRTIVFSSLVSNCFGEWQVEPSADSAYIMDKLCGG